MEDFEEGMGDFGKNMVGLVDDELTAFQMIVRGYTATVYEMVKSQLKSGNFRLQIIGEVVLEAWKRRQEFEDTQELEKFIYSYANQVIKSKLVESPEDIQNNK